MYTENLDVEFYMMAHMKQCISVLKRLCSNPV